MTDRALFKHLQCDFAVFRVVDLRAAHGHDLADDFGVDDDVLRHEDAAACEVGPALFPEQGHVVFLGDALKFVDHVGGEEGLG